MHRNVKITGKQILSDPVWAFTKLQPDSDQDKVNKLKNSGNSTRP
jgi:hypothetical protein